MSFPDTRRTFLRSLAPATAIGSASLPLLSSALAATSGEDRWRKVRQEFAFSDQHVPLNAANLCPSPRVVTDRLIELTRDIDGDCSFHNRAKFEKTLEESRGKIAAQLGVSADEIALVRNTSEANNIINNGLPLRAGDEVVLWSQNHPTNNVAWDVRAARFGIVPRRVETPAEPKDAAELIAAFEKALTARTRVLAITHVSNETGVRLPVRELCELAHKRGLYVHVDGAQSWGVLAVNLRELGCDSYSASAHKWFTGPREAGILYVRSDRVREIWPNTVAPGWGTDADPDVTGARKFESSGQRDDACLASLATAADFHAAIGREAIEDRVFDLAGVLKQQAREQGWSVTTPMARELSAGVCVLAVPPDKRKAVLDELYQKWGIAGSSTGGLRLCPHLYNTRDHINRAVNALAGLRRHLA